MKKIYKHLLLAMAGLVCAPAPAQVSAYLFAQSNGTYTPITGGTVVATATANTSPGNLASTVWNLTNGTFPFPFVFNGNSYTGCNISCNGYITFGTVAPATTLGTPISGNTNYDGAVSAWGRANNGAFNLGTGPFYTSEIRAEAIGTAPNRTMVIQFDNWRYASGTGTTVWLKDFQIRLIETTNVVEIVYGPGVMAGGSLSTSGFNCQVGLRGATNADYNNRSSFGTFNTSTTGTINSASQVIGVNAGVGVFMPPDGLTYKWFPRCSGTPVTPTITANSTLICEGAPLNFGATGDTPYFDITYQWQQSPTPGGPYTNVSPAASGTAFASYQTAAATGTFYYVLVSTCPNATTSATSNEFTVDVRPLPILNVISSPALNTSVTPIETCFGETYTLTSTGASTYTWASGPSTASYVVQPGGNPIYTVTGTSVDGCVSTKTLAIKVNPLPVISMLAAPNAICPGKPVVVGATGNAVTYTWVAQSSNAFLITVTPTVTTTYTVLGTAATGCTNTATQQVVVYTVSPVTAMSSVSSGTICKGETLTLSATGANSYTWSAPGTYAMGPSVSASPEQTTTYTLTGVDLNGCISQTTLVQSVSECTGLNDAAGNFNSLKIYPNPSNGVFTVELTNGAAKTLDVMDLTGKVVLSASTNSDKAELSIRELANGIYYLRIQSNNSVQVVKLIKQ